MQESKVRQRYEDTRKVALSISMNEYAFGREKVKGIIDYYRKDFSWEIHRNELSQPFVAPQSLLNWDGDGVIGEIYAPEDADVFSALSIPAVNTSSSRLVPDIPSVSVDNRAIGRLAAEHLIELKLDHFAYVGAIGLHHVRGRYEEFLSVIEKSGSHCSLIEYEPRLSDERCISEELIAPDELLDRLRNLTLPVGIMAATDRVGFAVLEACRQIGLRCPEDVALIGVDNDEIFCNLAGCSMTSIEPNSRKVGYEAAAMLDQLMSGTDLENRHILIPPERIVFRGSTDMPRSESPEVAQALRFIRSHANEQIDVTSVLNAVPVSRRSLETKFKAETGHGIYYEIRRVHVELAKQLLESTDRSPSRISWESGFSTPERMEIVFRKQVGMSTAEYRKKSAGR